MRSNWPVGLLSATIFMSTAVGSAVAEATSFMTFDAQFSCEEAARLKFNQAEYEALPGNDQVVIDATYQQCRIDKEAADKAQPPTIRTVLVPNPAGTEDDKLFYGLVSRDDIDNAKKNCETGGQVVGLGMIVAGSLAGNPGATEAGKSLYTYTDVSCSAFANGIADGNVMVLFAPAGIIEVATANKVFADAVKSLPLMSQADKDKLTTIVSTTTAPPEVKIEDGKIEVKTGLGTFKTKVW